MPDYIPNTNFPTARGNLNAVFEDALTFNASTTEPAPMIPYLLWLDISLSTPRFKIRNAANTAWINLGDLREYFGTREAVGTIKQWAGATAPTGWLFCEGQTVAAATYPQLFNVCGYTYGGSGSSFMLPDMRDRAIYGVSGSRARGAKFGSGTASLAIANMPTHSHGGGTHNTNLDHNHGGSTTNVGSHSHSLGTLEVFNTTIGGGAQRYTSGGGSATAVNLTTNPSGDHFHTLFINYASEQGFNLNHYHGVYPEGSGTAFSVQNPGIAIASIIKFDDI
jgi:microcystin-dependent protein